MAPKIPTPMPWDDPVPLGMSTANLPDFPAGALGRPLGPYVVALAETMQTPVDLPATVALGIAAASIGGRVRVQCPAHVEPTNLFVVPVMPPASRKSGVVQACRVPLAEAEQLLRDKLGSEVYDTQTAFEVAYKRAETLKTAAAKSGDPSELQAAQEAVRDAEVARLKVRAWPRLTTSDATPEALIGLLAEQRGAIAAISAEAGLFASLTGRYGKTPNLEPVLSAHAGDEITVDRRSRAPEHVLAPALTVVCSIQPFALREMVERPDFAGRGLLARVMWSLPRDNAGYRRVRDVAAMPAAVEQDYRETLRDLAYQAATLDEVLTLTLSPGAVEVFYQYAEHAERLLRPSAALGRHRLTKEWGGKLAGVAARIAGCLHACRHNLTRTLIDEHTMRDAVTIADYFAAHAVVALTESADEDASQARTLLAYLLEKNLTAFKVRDLRSGPKSLRKADALTPVIADLIDAGWLREAEDGGWLTHPDAAKFLDPGDRGDRGDSAGQGVYDPVAPAGDAGDSEWTSGLAVAPVALWGDSETRGAHRDDLRKCAPVAPVAPVAPLSGDEWAEWSA